MIVNEAGVVLARWNAGELDRLVWLYTPTFGKVSVRFRGVNKPAGKLKALTEPLVLSEHRLHVNPRTDSFKSLGGKLINGFPGLREDVRRTSQAMLACEMVAAVAPQRSPNRDKFDLLVGVLEALAERPNLWLVPAFGLRLLDLAGIGVARAPAGCPAAAWAALRESGFDDLAELPWSAPAARACEESLFTHLEEHSGRALRGRAFLGRLDSFAAEPVAC